MVAGGQMVRGGAWSALPKTHSRGGEKVLNRIGLGDVVLALLVVASCCFVAGERGTQTDNVV